MRSAIVWGKCRKDGTPAIRADRAFDQNATAGKYEIRTASANFIPLRVVLISSGGLGQFLLILRLVLLRCGSGGATTGRGGGRNAHCFDKSSPRRSGSRHGCPSLVPGLVNIVLELAVTKTLTYGASGSIWTSLLVCWPSVHMLERTLGSELFCTSIWRVLMEVGRR